MSNLIKLNLKTVNVESNTYAVNPPYCTKRLPQRAYTKAKRVSKKWEAIAPSLEGSSGNVRPDFNKESGEFFFCEGSIDWQSGIEVGMHEAISSALLLYRTLCLFSCQIQSNGPDGYKIVWSTSLRHKDTGEILSLGEWKGGAGTWTRFSGVKQCPDSFRDDLLELLNLLASPECPHPYDGTVAGTVA